MRRGYAATALCLLLLLSVLPMRDTAVHADERQSSIVFIVTDDQRADTLWVMSQVRSLLGDHGLTFTNAFASNPLCCPSRATILTGNYSHTTGVYTNVNSPVGGFQAFDDSSTLATWLDGAGYRTALIGKYLNGYRYTLDDGYIPPGWDRWFASDGYFDYPASDQGHALRYGDAPEDYSTDVLAGKAGEFIRETPPDTPLFLYFAPRAPHAPATPAPRYADALSDLQVEMGPNYDEADISDKPAYVRGLPPLPDTENPFPLSQYRSLLAVDDAVGTIVSALEETERLSNTLIVFTSDNGMLWGEHRLINSKNSPYEESIRVPLVIRYDPFVAAPGTSDSLVVNIDLAPTAAAAAGITVFTEGSSLLPLLTGEATTWRRAFLLEHLRKVAPPYCGVRASRFSYVKYETWEEELYDLVRDPYQLTNVASHPAYAGVLAKLRAVNSFLCDPPPPFTYNLP